MNGLDLGNVTWGDYRFEDPWLLLLGLIVPMLVLLKATRRAEPAGIGFSRVAAIARTGGVRRAFRWLPFGARMLAALLLVVAIARPQRGSASATVVAEGIDIVLVLDVSSSMDQRDFEQRSRLEVAQEVLRDFIEAQPDDRIGVIAFESAARVLSPLTLDHDPLLRIISTAGESELEDGTAIGLATAEAVDLLRESRATSRIIVLLTDGENNAGAIEPIEAARLAEALGVRVYTIGVLGAGEQGLDEATLREMADIGDGTYDRASGAAALAAIYERVSDLEKSRVERDRFLQYDDLAPFLLAAAATTLVFEVLLRATAFRRIP